MNEKHRNEVFFKQFFKCIGSEKPHAWGKKHNIDRGVIERITKGKIPDPHNLIKVAKALNVSIDYLLTGETRKGKKEIEAEEKIDSYERIVDRKEKEYVDKLLQIFRTKNEDVKRVIMQNIDIFLKMFPPISKK